jgi:hypothetical protein
MLKYAEIMNSGKLFRENDFDWQFKDTTGSDINVAFQLERDKNVALPTKGLKFFVIVFLTGQQKLCITRG